MKEQFIFSDLEQRGLYLKQNTHYLWWMSTSDCLACSYSSFLTFFFGGLLRVWAVIGVVAMFSCATPRATSKTTQWIGDSNAIVEEFTQALAKRYPETGSALGITEFDDEAVKLKDDMASYDYVLLQRWQTKCDHLLARDIDENLKTDVKILSRKIQTDLMGLDVAKKEKEIIFYPVTKWIYQSLRGLINSNTNESRKRSAVDRFKKLIQGQEGFKPFVLAAHSRIRYFQKLYSYAPPGPLSGPPSGPPLYPLRSEVEAYLKDSPSYLDGIKKLLEQSNRDNWADDFERLKDQVSHYDRYLKKSFLPRCRSEAKTKISEPFYRFYLETKGVRAVSPKDLIKLAKQDYQKKYREWGMLAAKIAKKRSISDTSSLGVLKVLKKSKIGTSEAVLKKYTEISQRLETLIREHQILTLPDHPLMMRVADLAESKAAPVPHLNPPPLIQEIQYGEVGYHYPEVVLPDFRALGTQAEIDDFSYEAIAPVLMAHEGRPGHDLQFTLMLQQGVSLARAFYAFNSVNVEGWGLYAEDLVFSYLSDEEKFAAVQARLWRIARMFLDPQLNLGQITPAEVLRTLTMELGLSKAMAESELKRYAFEDVAQATAYYWGYLKLIEIRDSAISKLGERFRLQEFNDQLLSFGLLNVEILADRMRAWVENIIEKEFPSLPNEEPEPKDESAG